jgi:hypothetical protein
MKPDFQSTQLKDKIKGKKTRINLVNLLNLWFKT